MFHCQRLINVVVDTLMVVFVEWTVGPFGGKNTINSYGCLRYNPAPEIFLKGRCPMKNIPTTGTKFFLKKKFEFKKMQSNYFAIFNDFTQNSTYMKKGSFTSKLSSPFFIQSKFKLFRQGQLPVIWIHYCRFLARGGGCHATGFASNHHELIL
jgi:hypothetical protein